MLAPRMASCGLPTLVGLSCLATAVACGPDAAPELAGLADQVAQVGSELTVVLDGTDREGDRLTYGFHAADLADLAKRAQITQSPSGAGVFRWTPLAADVGRHAVDFTASDGRSSTTVTIAIDVRSAIGAATAPVFRQPLGSGTTLDLARQACVDLEIVVDDQDTASLAIGQGEPVIDGAELRVRDGRSATWHWCPTRAQQAEPRYTLVLTADDGDNPRTVKNYLVVLRGGTGASCPGSAPVISHTPADVRSILDVRLTAAISDDKGIKDAPLLYYATTQPASPPDLSRMTMVQMAQVSGDRRSGSYAGTVANPVAGMPAERRATLYYVFAASDDDDPTGSCDHSTISQVYATTVTSSGAAALPICAPCSANPQCGPGNECVRMGAAGASYCLASCDACPAGYTCSSSEVPSVDGSRALQCVPQSGSCERPAGACSDDAWEANDTRSDASHNPALTPELYDLVSCPSTTSATQADDDWYRIIVAHDQRVDLQLAGGPETDLDLHLYRADGTPVTASTSPDPDEEINACLTAGTYYVKVNGYGSARNAYLLSYETRDESCNTTCQDDAREDDDSYSQARPTTSPDFSSSGNAICPGDDDWYQVRLVTGDVLTVDLAFTQSNDNEDLDLHLYKDSVDLTPCDPAHAASCTPAHGQGAVSNEHTTYTTPAGCDAGCNYFVVVRGYNGSANRYGITLGIR